MLTADEIRQDVKEMVAELTEVEIEEISDTADFQEELDVDSLMAIELMVFLDKKYGINLPEEDFRETSNVNEAVELIMRQLKGPGNDRQ